MATEMKMPQLGESVTEGTISKWFVKPGQAVTKYEPIAEVITDKVSAEIPSSFTGSIRELIVQEDETVAVGAVICTIDTEESGDASSVPERKSQEPGSSLTQVGENDQSQKRRYSPAVLRMAEEYSINLETVTGSGKGGRITRKDLKRIIEQGSIEEEKSFAVTINENESRVEPKSVINETVSTPVKVNQAQVEVGSNDFEIPLTTTRKAIAKNMVNSKHEIPHAWTMVEVDVTNLVNYRSQVKDEFKHKEGINLTFLPFFIKAIVEALKEFPQMNAMWAGDKIIQKKEINISLAVATEDALYVPVIKAADEKSIKGIAKEVHSLATKVRSGQIQGNDMQGGTFTVNNTGAFGSILSNPIINHPQAAILSVESIVKRPVVIECEAGDMMAIRSMVNLCLSLDHRVLDGLICGRFLARVKEILEEMTEKNTSIY